MDRVSKRLKTWGIGLALGLTLVCVALALAVLSAKFDIKLTRDSEGFFTWAAAVFATGAYVVFRWLRRMK